MISIQNLSVHAGSFSMHEISFEIPPGKYCVLMGRTGSGKTTLLEAICGLKRVSAGAVRLLGEDVTRCKPSGRGIGYVPQDGALFSTMTVRQHLAFAPSIRHWPKAEVKARVDELAEQLGITGLLDRKPKGLSGGERQRVALGRALAARPGVLCLDEPLSALDEDTREDMCVLLESMQKLYEVTTLHITHSHREARRLADIVLWIRDGRVEAVPFDEESRRGPYGNTESPDALHPAGVSNIEREADEDYG